MQLASSKKINEAIEALSKAKQSDPTWLAPYLSRAQMLSSASRHREALEEAQAALRVSPDDPNAILTALQLTPPQSYDRETEAMARKLVAQKPGDTSGHYYLALAIAASNDPKRYPEALAEMRGAHRLSPGSVLVLVEMAKIHRSMGQNADAAALLEMARDMADKTLREHSGLDQQTETLRSNAAYWLAQTYRDMGRVRDAQIASAQAARLSTRLREIRTLQTRAYASPPDRTAASRLQKLVEANRKKPG